MLDQRFSIIVEALWEMQFSLQNVLVNDERIVISKRVDASNHFVDQNTKCPPVYWFSMALILKNLGSKIFGSSTQGEGSVFDGFGKPKVCELKVAVRTNEDIFRLEVAVDDVLGVKIFENENNVRCVKAESLMNYAAL